MTDVKTLLNERIEKDFKSLEGVELGSEQYKATVDGITKLADRVIEIDKVEIERKEKADERLDRWVNNGLTGVKVIGGIVVAVWGTVATINFEKYGTITTQAGKKHVDSLFSFIRK